MTVRATHKCMPSPRAGARNLLWFLVVRLPALAGLVAVVACASWSRPKTGSSGAPALASAQKKEKRPLAGSFPRAPECIQDQDLASNRVTYQLPSGLRVQIDPIDRGPAVVQLVLSAGGCVAPPQLAHLTEHLVVEAFHAPNGESSRLRDLGIQVGGRTTPNHVSYHLTGPDRFVPLMLRRVAEAVTRSYDEADAISRQIVAVQEELENKRDAWVQSQRPGRNVRAAATALWTRNVMQYDVRRDIPKYGPRDVRRYMKRWYRPSLMELRVRTSYELDTVKRWVSCAFGDWKEPNDARPDPNCVAQTGVVECLETEMEGEARLYVFLAEDTVEKGAPPPLLPRYRNALEVLSRQGPVVVADTPDERWAWTGAWKVHEGTWALEFSMADGVARAWRAGWDLESLWARWQAVGEAISPARWRAATYAERVSEAMVTKCSSVMPPLLSPDELRRWMHGWNGRPQMVVWALPRGETCQ